MLTDMAGQDQTCLAVMWNELNSISVYNEVHDNAVMTITPPHGHEESELSDISCCSKGKSIFVSGLGVKRKQVYRYDVEKASWTLISELNHGRECHCMLEKQGNLFIFGGYDPETEVIVREVEVVNTGTGETGRAGQIHGSECDNTCCCLVGETGVVVLGPYDNSGELLLQVYSTAYRNVTNWMRVPGGKGRIWGAVKARAYILYASEYDIYVCALSDVYQRNENVRILNHYGLPCYNCTMTLSCDKQKVLLLGGNAKRKVHEAKITDVLSDSERGWLQVQKELNDRNHYTFPGAVCYAKIT